MRYLLTLFLSLLLLTSCARPPVPVWTELPDAGDLLQRLAANSDRFASLDAAAKVGLTRKGKYRSSQQFLLAQKPNRLRADVLTGFGQLVLQLAADGEELSVFLNTTVPGRFFRGPASEENLARFIQMSLSAGQLVQLLLYDPPLIDAQQTGVAVVDGQLVLRLIAADRQQELLFDIQLRLIGCRYLTGDRLQLEVLFSKHAATDSFPRKVRIELPAKQTRLSISYTDVQLNIPLAADRFRLQPPNNLVVEPLP